MTPLVRTAGQVSTEAEELYLACRPLLLYVATVKFGLPFADAENAIHEAMLSFLSSRREIENQRAWLVGAVSNACRTYWRVEFRRKASEISLSQQVVADALFVTEEFERASQLRDTLARLSPQQREVLRLHYFERLTAAEIAVRLGTTHGYAERLIHKALRRARTILGGLPSRVDGISTHSSR